MTALATSRIGTCALTGETGRPRAVFGASRAVLPRHSVSSRQLCTARWNTRRLAQRFVVRASSGGGDDDELPWERREKLEKLAETEGKDLPFGVYLLASAIVAIAAVGSIFEIANQNAIFGVLPPSNPLWLPILGFFAVTGFPTAGYLFYKCVNAANAAADRQNKIDGF